MNFYRSRPLAAALSLCIAVSAAAAFLGAVPKLILIATVVVAAIAAVVIFRGRGTVRICGLQATGFIMLTSALTLCMLLISFAYFNVYVAKYDSLSQEVICAEVVEVESRTAYSSVYRVRLREVGKRAYSAHGLVRCDSADTLAIGDVIVCEVKFSPLDAFYEYRPVSRLTMLADGNVFACDTVGSVGVVDTADTVEIRLAKLREAYSAKMALYLDRDSAALADALMLGEREGLGKIYRDFNYIGVLHILALSGLHLSVMCSGLDIVFTKLGIGRRLRYVLLVALMLFYIGLTGYLMSVMRAAIMLMITFAASLLDSESDKVTSLFFAVWLINLTNPAAMFDVSLQLSFCATLGVLLMSEAVKRETDKLEAGGKPLRFILGRIRRVIVSVGASLGATLFILPLQWLYFGEISTLSVPATIIMSVLCEGLLILLLPFVVCSLAGLDFICGRLGYLICLLSGIISEASSALEAHAELISLRYPFALPIIIGLTCVIVWMATKNFRSWLYALIPFSAACIVFITGVRLYEFTQTDAASVDYFSLDSHDAMLLVSDRQAMAIDITDGSGTLMWEINNALAERYFTELDAFMLIDIDRRHINSVRQLIGSRRIHRLLIPIPSDDYDAYMLDELYRIAEEYGTETVMYSPYRETELSFGDVTITMPSRGFIERSSEPLALMNFTYGEAKLTYAGSSAWENEYTWSYSDGARYMILGSNGPVFHSPPEGTADERLKFIALSPDIPVDGLKVWLDGFSGILMQDGTVRIDITP